MRIFQTKYGSFSSFNNDNDIINVLERNEIPDSDVLEFLRPYISEAHLIIDIGSSIGLRSLIYTKMNPSIGIYCFEPRENLFCLLTKNLAENNILNTVLINNMLGHVTGTMKIPTLKRIMCDHNDIIQLGNGSIIGSENDPVHLITLDSLRLLSCDIIFIDLIGLDYLVILGGLNTIKKFKPKICFRFSQTENDELFKYLGISTDKNKNSCDLLEKMEYSIEDINDEFKLATPILKPSNFNQIKINPVKVNPKFIPSIPNNNFEERENIEDAIQALSKAHAEAKEKIEEEKKAYTQAIEKAYSQAYTRVYEQSLLQAKTEAQARALAHAEAEAKAQMQTKMQENAQSLAFAKAEKLAQTLKETQEKIQLEKRLHIEAQAKEEKEKALIKSEEIKRLINLGYQFISDV